MGDFACRAKKVLFPDFPSAHHLGESNTMPSDSNNMPKQSMEQTRRRDKKSRRGRMANSGGTLAAISNPAASTMLKNCTNEKENRIPRITNKRGALQKMDSLAVVIDLTEDGMQRKKSGVRQSVERRSDEASSSSIFLEERFDRYKSRENVPAKAAVNVECNIEEPMRQGNIYAAKSQPFSKQYSSDNLSLQGNNSNNSCASEPKKGRRNRRRGRCNHPVSSLVQQHSVSRAETNVRRGSTVSSLMNLSSSTQKPQINRAANRRSKKNIDRKLMEDDLVRNIQSIKIDDTKTNNFKSPLPFKQPKPSSPSFHSPIVYKQRPFVLPGECTSPPSFLHRLSSVSNNMFQKSTPGKNNAFSPGSSAKPRRKRMDKKKTPDKLTAKEECGLSVDLEPMEVVSPLVTEFSVTPTQFRRRRRKSLNNPVERVTEDAVKSNGCSISFECCQEQEETSHTGVSPQNLLSSPLQSASHSSPEFGLESPCAKANLFPAVESNPINGCVIPKRTVSEKIRGSAVLAVEMATPRVIKSASSEKSSGVDAAEKERIRGSAVLSVQKAPSLPKKDVVSLPDSKDEVAKQCADTKTESTKKKSGCKPSDPMSHSSKTSVSKKVAQTKSKPIPVEEGTRRSARESKPTDRLTVTWNDTIVGKTSARFNSKDLLDVSSSAELDGNTKVDVLPELAKKEDGVNVNSKNTIPEQTCDGPLPDDYQWSNEEVSMLRNAQNSIDPTVSEYWEEVACLIGCRSASECREKWFSLVATPKGRPQKENKKQPKANNKEATGDSSDEEDDLFHSTPLRESLWDMQNETLAKKLSLSSSFGTSFGLSPCIQSASVSNVSAPPDTTSALKDRRKGYKTYIDNLRKDLKPLHKNAKKATIYKTFAGKHNVNLESGDCGKLLHDGTVQFTLHEESDDEDDFFDDEDEE